MGEIRVPTAQIACSFTVFLQRLEVLRIVTESHQIIWLAIKNIPTA